MYMTYRESVAKTKLLKDAMLLSTLLNKPLRIETKAPGAIPAIPCSPYATIVNDQLLLQAVDPNEPRRAPNRKLNRDILGDDIHVVCNYDCVTNLMLHVAPGKQFVFLDMRSNDAPVVPASILDAMCLSVDSGMTPDDVVFALEDILGGSSFTEDYLRPLFYRAEIAERETDFAFLNRISKAVRATRPDTVESAECREIGLKTEFGFGVGDVALRGMLVVLAANAAIEGRKYCSREDLVRFFPSVVAHRINWGAAKPQPGYLQSLTKIAEWAVSV